MKQEDIMKLAREAGLITSYGARETATDKLLEHFAKLVAAAQPEQERVAWVGLTDEELFEIMDKANTRYQAVQMTQAKLRELNAPQIDPNQWAFDNGLEST